MTTYYGEGDYTVAVYTPRGREGMRSAYHYKTMAEAHGQAVLAREWFPYHRIFVYKPDGTTKNYGKKEY